VTAPPVQRSRRRIAATLFVLSSCAPTATLLAQVPVTPEGRPFWMGAAVVAGAALLIDGPARTFAAAHQTRTLDHAADVLDPLGRAEYLVPSLAAAIVLPCGFGKWPLAWDAVQVGSGYAASDLAGGALRVLVSRHRPDSSGDPWRFRPLHPQGDWGSMPSAHVTHAFALAAGIAQVSGRPWAGMVAYGFASMVAAQRVYRQAHWTSDVVVGAALSIDVSRRTIRLLRGEGRS
jgi:membrane-associated phospholipid phosphatase